MKLLPKKLYKYRNFNSNHKKALFSFELWAGTGTSMMDDKDCSIDASKSKCVSFLDGKMKPEVIESTYKTLINNFNDYFRSSKYIISLCETFNSDTMWNEYSDKNTGFVIEYRTTDIIAEVNKLLDNIYSNLKFSEKIENQDVAKIELRRNDPGLYKVTYKKEPYDITEQIIEQLNILYREQVLGETISWNRKKDHFIKQARTITNIITTKKYEYSFEKEWRVVVPSLFNTLTTKAIPLLIVKPLKIILGKDVSKNNMLLMNNFCEENNIEIEQLKVT